METKLFTVAVYGENQVGLLNQIATIFTRRHLNIWSLTVSASDIEGIHRFTITTHTSEELIQRVVLQIEKCIEVLRAYYYADQDLFSKEIALYKIVRPALENQDLLATCLQEHQATLSLQEDAYWVIEKAGCYDETEQLYQALIPFDVIQFVRSGQVSVTR